MQMLTWFDKFMAAKCLDNEWVLIYGTTLGALRNGTILAHTEDVDIVLTPLAIQFLEQNHTRAELWRHGYSFWLQDKRNIWKLCPHLHHPSPHFQAAMVRDESLAAWEARNRLLMGGYMDFWFMWPVPKDTTTCLEPAGLNMTEALQVP
jgi:hypothetical protein